MTSAVRAPTAAAHREVKTVRPQDGSGSFYRSLVGRLATRHETYFWIRQMLEGTETDAPLFTSGVSAIGDVLRDAIAAACAEADWDAGEAWLSHSAGSLPTSHWHRRGRDADLLERLAATPREGATFSVDSASWLECAIVSVPNLHDARFDSCSRVAIARMAGMRSLGAVPICVGRDVEAVLIFYSRHSSPALASTCRLVRAALGPLGASLREHRLESGLESTVKERTSELRASHERLRLADRMAAIGTLAAGLGHDMNNVLLPVRAHLNAAHSLSRKRDIDRHVEEVQKSVAYLQHLADGLHYLSMDPDYRDGDRTSVNDWWTQTGSLLIRAVPKHVRVESSFPEGLSDVSVAPHRLTQAVLNLVVNAGEAIPAPRSDRAVRGNIMVSALQGVDSRGRPAVRISVADDGRGMTKEVRRRAFEMFFTTKTRGMGTGLGLPLVARVVESAGGEIDVETKVGRGTAISLVLPCAGDPSQSKDRKPRAVVVSLSDGRTAGLVRQLLGSSGVASVPKRSLERADVWVVDPREVDLERARTWRRKHADRPLVVVGLSRKATKAWRALYPIVVEHADDFTSLRQALIRALRC